MICFFLTKSAENAIILKENGGALTPPAKVNHHNASPLEFRFGI